MGPIKFHKEVGFEPGATEEIMAALGRLSRLTYTRHAQLETIKDRYKIIPVLKLADIEPDDIFEYTRMGGRIERIAIRVKKFDQWFDFCYSVSLEGMVVTAWANSKDDDHSTLRRREYEYA